MDKTNIFKISGQIFVIFCLLFSLGCGGSSSSGKNNSTGDGNTDPVDNTGDPNKGLLDDVDIVLTVSGVSMEGFSVAWNKPDLDAGEAASAEYRVYTSQESNISTVEEVENNGTPVNDWQSDISSADVTSLDQARKYYINVLVRLGDTVASYQQESQATLPAGMPDASFNGSGVFRNDASIGDGEYDSGVKVLADNEDNVYLIGNRRNGSTANTVLLKLTQDGMFDNTFGNNGMVLTRFGEITGSTFEPAWDAAFDSNGRIVATGHIMNAAGDSDVSVWRYNTDGSIDMTFGPADSGFVAFNDLAGGNGNDRAQSIAISEDDEIFITGFSTSSLPNTDMLLMKLTSDGEPDASFGDNGVVTHNGAAGGQYWEKGNKVILDNHGRILVAGSGSDPSNGGVEIDMVIWRYNADGTLDTSFGLSGVVVNRNVAGYNGADQAFGIAVTSDDHIIASGYSMRAGGDGEMTVWRFTDNGFLDINFGASGTVILGETLGGNKFDLGRDLVLDDAENILITGYGSANDANGQVMAMWRLTETGALDVNFGGSGTGIYAYTGDNATITFGHSRSITLDSHNRILVVGSTSNVDIGFELTAWRFR